MYDIDATLFTNNPKVEIPQWINDTKFSAVVQPTIDINFDSGIINRKHVLAERSTDDTANIREIKLTFDDKQLKTFAINQLNKEFRKYRFNIINASINNGEKRIASINAKFDKCPLTYTFSYSEQGGQLIKEPFFRTAMENAESNEYPFSVAGLEDSFNDAKNIKVTAPSKVATKYNYNVITRYDIVQRCNNRLAEAKALIEKHTKENNIVAIGSNEYASTYDVNYLFPDKRVAFAGEQSHQHDFVKNKVATASYEHKSANRLALEANNIINNTFKVNRIVAASREDNKLFVTAELVNNNVRNVYNFDFDIKNESIDKLNYIENNNYERFTAKQLLAHLGEMNPQVANYLNNNNKIANGYVYSTKTIKAQLKPFMTNSAIDNMLNNWVLTKLASKLNSTTYASKYSLQELIINTNTQFMNEEEIKQIRTAQKTFGEGQNYYFYETKENDTRNKIAIAKKEQFLNNINKYINQYFKNFTFKYLGDNKLTICFDNKKHISASIQNKHIVCDLNGKQVKLKNLADTFKNSKVLTAYLKDNNIKASNNLSQQNKIIIQKAHFYKKLKDYLSEEDINNLITDLENAHQIVKVASNQYASSNSFENLIRNCAYELDNSIKEVNLQKANRTEYLKTLKAFLKDNDTRTTIAIINNQQRLAKAYKYIDNYLKDYTLRRLDDNHIVINFQAEDGKTRNITASIRDNDIWCHINNYEISIKDLSRRFKNSKILTAYLKDNRINNVDRNKMVISKQQFINKLQNYLAIEDITNMFQNLVDNKLLVKTASDKYASEYNFEDLIRRCDIDINNEARALLMQKKNRLQGKEVTADYDLDNDTRNVASELTVADFQNNIMGALPQNIQCESINNVQEQYDNGEKVITAECVLFNSDTGLKTIITASQKNNEKININNNFADNTLVNTYNKYNSQKKQNNKIIISKSDIINKLSKIANVNNIDNVLAELEKKSYITDIGNNKYASHMTFAQLMSLSDIMAYNSQDIAQQYRKANASTEYISKSYHVADCDSKNVNTLSDGRTKNEFNNAKNKCFKHLVDLFNKHKITAKKAQEIKGNIKKCANERELNECYCQINRYDV